jgi:limonene-1,2-epoxide hydrolase
MIVQDFKQLYLALNKDNISLLENLYDNDIVFIDPFNQIETLENLKRYFSELYQNVQKIHFDFIDFTTDKNNHYLTWEMKLTHPKLNSNKEFIVCGVTHLRSNELNKITYHRDYFDAGSMLYERIPVIGRVILWLKNKL